MRWLIEQALDVKLYNPVVFPTTLARDSYGIQCRLSWPVRVGVCQEYRIEIRLNDLLDHHLGHAISYGGHGDFILHLALQVFAHRVVYVISLNGLRDLVAPATCSRRP